jgi:putative DNA primase/helicase
MEGFCEKNTGASSLSEELDYSNINEWSDFWFHDVGVNVIPMISRNKGNTQQGFSKVKYTQYQHQGKEYNLLKDELPVEIFDDWKSRNLFSDGIAIVGGEVYRGKMKGKYLIMMDFDNQKAIDEWFPKGLDRSKSITLIEQHLDAPYKAHAYYYSEKSCPRKESSTNSEDDKNQNTIPLIEVKGEGTHGIHVVTPSIHSDGEQYQIVSDVLRPTLYNGELDVDVDIICQRYSIPYLTDAYLKSSTDTKINYDDKNLKVPEGGGRRPMILKAIERWLRMRQENLDDPELKENALKYALDWNKKHCSVPLSSERVMYQVKCAWDYIQKLKKDKSLYPVTPKDQKGNVIGITAEKISQNHRFATLRDTREMLMYDEKLGVYRQNFAESIIQEETEQEIEDCTHSDRFEVVEKIKVSTYKDRMEFDNDPRIIITANGILNLSQLEFQEHSPNILATAMIPVNYVDPEKSYEATDETTYETITELIGDTEFFKYLESCFTINDMVRQNDIFTVMEAFASIILKTPKFEKAIMFIGSGENGKSVLLHYITNFIGEENISNESIQKLSEDKFSVAELYGKLANIVPDIESNELRKTGIIKQLVSGDRISAQRKHQHPFKFSNYATLMFSANKFPKVFDQSNGMFRRFLIVKWERQFTKEQRNADLKYTLTSLAEEKSKVLSLLIILGRRMMVRGRFKHEPKVDVIRKEWNELADPVSMFVNDATILIATDEATDMVSRKDMWDAFQKYQMANQVNERYTIVSFGKAVGEYFESEVKRAGDDGVVKKIGRYWIGVKLVKKAKEHDGDGADENQKTIEEST